MVSPLTEEQRLYVGTAIVILLFARKGYTMK
jgi:hypothetical protein